MIFHFDRFMESRKDIADSLSLKRFDLLQNKCEEDEDLVNYVQSGNLLIDKCILTFSSLAVETEILWEQANNEYFNTLLSYGESGGQSYKFFIF